MSSLAARGMISPAEDSLSRHATAQIAVGTIVDGPDGEFLYVTAGAALGSVAVSGEPVSLTTSLGAVVAGDLDIGAFLGIAEAPFASGESGFIRTKGPALAIVESGAAAGDYLQLSSTTGKLKKLTTSGQGVAIAKAASDNNSAAHIAIRII